MKVNRPDNHLNLPALKQSKNLTFYLFVIRSTDQKIIFNVQADYQRCIQMIKRLEQERGIYIQAYCLMPGYLKLIAGLQSSNAVAEITLLDKQAHSPIWKDFSRLVARSSALQSQCVRISHPQRLSELKKYVECEAVRVGFVKDAGQYRYCSAHI